MTRRASRVSDVDLALLRAIGREKSVVAAGRRVGVSHDVAVYRLRRLARAFGGPVATGVRGGPGHGGTTLTPLGDRVLREGFDAVELVAARPVAPVVRPNLLTGAFSAVPSPRVFVGPGLTLRVAFRAEEGERVAVVVDPESVLVGRRRFPSSARNTLAAVVEKVVRARGAPDVTLWVRAGPARLRVAVTDEPVRELGLRAGARVVLFLKATAIRRVATPRASRGRPRP